MLSQALLKDICQEGAGERRLPRLRGRVPVTTDLREPSVLLQPRREHAGAAGWRGVHMVVAEAAEEGAEEAAASLLLEADVTRGRWEEKQHAVANGSTHARTHTCDVRCLCTPCPQSPDTRRPTQDKTRGPRKLPCEGLLFNILQGQLVSGVQSCWLDRIPVTSAQWELPAH